VVGPAVVDDRAAAVDVPAAVAVVATIIKAMPASLANPAGSGTTGVIALWISKPTCRHQQTDVPLNKRNDQG
jgi:hypothetical protein